MTWLQGRSITISMKSKNDVKNQDRCSILWAFLHRSVILNHWISERRVCIRFGSGFAIIGATAEPTLRVLRHPLIAYPGQLPALVQAGVVKNFRSSNVFIFLHVRKHGSSDKRDALFIKNVGYLTRQKNCGKFGIIRNFMLGILSWKLHGHTVGRQ